MTLWIAMAALAAQGQGPAPPASVPVEAAAPAPAEQWEAFHNDSEGRFEVDASRIVREGGQVDAWVRQVYPRPSPPFGMKTFVLHNRIDCRRRRAVTFSMEGFLEDGTSLGVLNYAENERPNERVSRQGGDGAMLRRLCGESAD